MASGRLGAADLAATTNTEVYPGPDPGEIATVNISVSNRNSSAVGIRLAVTDGALSDEDYIEYDVPVTYTLERTGVVVAEGQTIVAYSDTAAVSVVVWGWEEKA